MAEEEEFDRRGYHKKEYKPRISPPIHWREAKFVQRYRLSKARVQALSDQYSRHARTKGTNIGGGISHYDQMCLAIRYFATGANFSTIAETQQVSSATVSRCVWHVSRYFYYYHHRYIIWPSLVRDKMAVARKFFNKHGEKPLVMGLIDGTHIPIISPSKEREAVFVNRKGYYSLNTTVVCDAEQRILHINPCFAGSAQDSFCFNSSELYDEAEAGEWGDFVLLGDSGYGLKKYLFIPYLNPTTDEQKEYNTWHRSTRSLVERTIGVLKQRWRCLDASGGYLHHKPEKVARIVIACACLHNCAVEDRVPHDDANDVDDDRFRWRRFAPPQPDAEVHRGQQRDATRRDEYVRLNFGLPQEGDNQEE